MPYHQCSGSSQIWHWTKSGIAHLDLLRFYLQNSHKMFVRTLNLAKHQPKFGAQGVAAMEAGQWDAAVAAFTSALHAAAAQRRPTGQGAQYLAAVRLVKESTVAGNKLQRARLTRYAAALNGLEERHRLALAQSAATRNMEVGNFRWGHPIYTGGSRFLCGATPGA